MKIIKKSSWIFILLLINTVWAFPQTTVMDIEYRKYDLDFTPFLAETRNNFSSAFRQALTEAIKMEKEIAATEENPFRVRINIPENTYKITSRLYIGNCRNIEFDGNGSTIINTALTQSFELYECDNVAFTNMSLDYDPLPFTQGTVTEIEGTGTVLHVKVDAGYPSSRTFAAMMTPERGGFVKVFDHYTRALKAGARDFFEPHALEYVAEGEYKLTLRWAANDVGPGQLPVVVGDVVLICPAGNMAITAGLCANLEFSNFNIYASPGFAFNQYNGYGKTRLKNLNVIPGPKPANATEERLCSTNSDGTHFGSIQYGPIVTGCRYVNCSDDPINVHNFYYYIVKKNSDTEYIVSPKWDDGLEDGDEIQTCDRYTFVSKGVNRITGFLKTNRPDLQAEIDEVWENKSPTSQGTWVYEITLEKPMELEFGDAVSSLTRTGQETIILDSEFRGGGRVLIKTHNAVVENCRFTYSSGPALFMGSDIGYWSESSFATDIRISKNVFDHCMLGSNVFFGDLAGFTVGVGLVYPNGSNSIVENYENKNIIIEDNIINDSYGYGLSIMNGDNIIVRNNVIGNTFLRGTSFDMGAAYSLKPSAAVVVAMSKNITFTNNAIQTGKVAEEEIHVHSTCDTETIIIE